MVSKNRLHQEKKFEDWPSQTKIRFKTVRKIIGDSSSKTILDIGAGLMPLSKGVLTKKTITMDGVPDYNPTICCNFSKEIKLGDKSVDLILAGEIIEHIRNPFTFIRECNRVLKKGGQIIITTPNICSFKNRIKMIFGKLPEYCAEPLDDDSYERHIVDFSLKRLEDVMTTCGFKVILRKSNGIIVRATKVFPIPLTPVAFGETLIIKAQKIV